MNALLAVSGMPHWGASAWHQRALCAQTDPDTFFPEKGCSSRPAKRVCARCEAAAECLAYAMAHDERHGVWGGLSENERRTLRRFRRHANPLIRTG